MRNIRFLKLANNNRGNTYIETLVAVAIILVFIMAIITIPEPFMKKQNLDYMARTIARAVETNGEINSNVEQLINDLKTQTGITPTIVWHGNFVGTNRRIQIREKFSVVLESKVTITVAEPSFSKKIEIEIPIKKEVQGISEVYWKPGDI